MENWTGADAGFVVYAVCVKKPKQYAVVSSDFTTPPLTRGGASVTCPRDSTGKLMKPTSGGAIGTSLGHDQNVAALYPNGTHAWTTDVYNNETQAEGGTAFAVCGKYRHYSVQDGTGVVATSGDQTPVEASCPEGSVAVGGGVHAFSSDSLRLSVGSTFPLASDTWISWENNGTPLHIVINAVVVCIPASS